MIPRSGAFAALAAALLFGASTPFAKVLLGDVSPLLLAGLLYLGSGCGLSVGRLLRDRGWCAPQLSPAEWPWLLAAIGFGGVLGPVLLMYGLLHSSAASASLLLNLEAVSTAVIAWGVFRENADTRIVLGMLAIVAGAVVLSWPASGLVAGRAWGSLCVAGACLCWAIDNNLTRKVAASDALFIAGLKGLMAGIVNTVLALLLGARLPAASALGGALTLGLLGYGISLVLFVLALRGLGSARTGAYFSTAPFMGAAIAILIFHDATPPAFWLAAVLMGIGVWLHLSEHHEHVHTHQPMMHTHPHVHDSHHQHVHGDDETKPEPHTHAHRHVSLTHAHPHYPDIHHRHPH